MPQFGNLLTEELSSHWCPYMYQTNAFLQSVISASSVYNGDFTNFGFNFVTGSGNLASQTDWVLAQGGPKERTSIRAESQRGWLVGWTAEPLTEGSGSVFFDLDQGIGRTEALDSFIIQSAANSAYAVGGYAISASHDGSTWTGLTSSIYYPGGTGINGQGYDATITFNNTSSYRHYRVTLLDGNGTFGGFNNIMAWDSSNLNQINLFNPNESNVTASFIEATSTSLTNLTSFPRENYGWYFSERIGSVDFNWGDGQKLIRGFFVNGYYVGNLIFPGIVQFFKSNTGDLDDWELISTINIEDQQTPRQGENYVFDIGTPVKTQYLRVVLYSEGGVAPTNNASLVYSGWMYEMISASAPPTPTNLTVEATSNSNVLLNWSQNSGSDNRLIDLAYNIERSSDGGSNYTKIVTLSGSNITTSNTSSNPPPILTNYVDLSVPDGDYLYRVQAENVHHLTTGSYATSATITVPSAGGGSTSKKIYVTNKGNILINPNDNIIIEL